MKYNKSNFPPAPKFSELNLGDVFVRGDIAYMVIEEALNDYGQRFNAICLSNGYLEAFDDTDDIIPCPDAELIFRK